MELRDRTAGLVLCRFAGDGPEALMVRKRYSYAFIEFVYGRYSRKVLRSVITLIEEMSIEERLDVYSLNFDLMWFRVWLDRRAEPGLRPCYEKKQARFARTWMRDDGRFLRALLEQAQGRGRSGWELPRGHAAPGEDALACAQRECEEETGVSSKRYRIIPNATFSSLYVHRGVFHCVYHAAVAKVFPDPGQTISVRRWWQVAEVSEVRWMDLRSILRECEKPTIACVRWAFAEAHKTVHS